MNNTPKRPIVFRFVVGKGNVKRRRESEDTTRATIEQVTLAFAEANWEKARRELAAAIHRDVEIELIHIAGEFRRYVIGAPYNQRGLVGTLTTKAKGGAQPRESLGSLPRWAPRGAKYLARKFKASGQDRWFDNTGWAAERGGTLKEFFESDRAEGNEMFIGSGGIFEDMFGGVSVEVIRNNRGWGVNQGTMTINSKGKTELQMATVRVRALGKITDSMLRISDSSNKALLDVVGRTDPNVALHLRGGRGRYRPTLEPYLKFFLQRSIPQAVTQRIAKGTASGRLFRTPSRG